MSEPCQYGTDTREMLNKMETRLNGNLTRLWKEVNNMNNNINGTFQNRLPAWATFVISFLMLLVGALISDKLKRG